MFSNLVEQVLLAEYRKTAELFAIKTMKKRDIVMSDSLDRLMCEQRILEMATRARHPFLVNMSACFQTEQHTCFVLEYAAGGDLLTHSEAGPFPEPRTLDIKLANMLLDSEGYLKITDFGYCKEEMGFRNYSHSLTGTTDYLAPEMILEKSYTRSADWWSLGVCIYEMLVGKTPFYAYDDLETRYNIISKHVRYPKFLSREAVLIIHKLTFKKPWRRLGAGPRGAEEVKRHSFFRDIPWDDLMARKIEPPWVPTINNLRDVSNFEDQFTAASPDLTPPLDPRILTQDEQGMFDGFDVPYTFRESGVSGAESVASG
ncbi:hypothetical protein SKAU_G00257960 [Synaphobranchus kaupii]|uniref:Uncharacterized protein n=1 Tax=Synaphobranchus kaupii TaxID=118154 RepID=A0A9Q1F4C7_SYNKA|nr:hypothetical protein SKAU_G00257960 [Synaphobranchus kaupii]